MTDIEIRRPCACGKDAACRARWRGCQAFDTAGAGRAVTAFIDDLSNWYVRRSRARFWNGDTDALTTLHECLDIVTRLMAPFTRSSPNRCDVIAPGRADAPESVHLATWPQPDSAVIDTALIAFAALLESLGEVAGDGVHPGLFTEVFWASLHGLATLTRAGRLPPGDAERRVELLVDRLAVV